jgi:hypothetical protein
MAEPERAEPTSVARGFLFADLRNYSGWVESHGDHAAAALLRESFGRPSPCRLITRSRRASAIKTARYAAPNA